MWIRTVIFLLAFFIAIPSHAGPPPGSNANARALAATGTSAFSDYFMRPSESGIPEQRNVIVWRQTDEFGSTCFVARVFFKTDDYPVAVELPGEGMGFVHPDQIFVWQMVCGGEDDPNYILEYIYAVPESGFEDTEAIQIREDGGGDGFDRNDSYGYRFTFDSVPFGDTELVHTLETYEEEDGSHIVDNNWSRHLARLGEPLTVNGMTFDDVAVVNFLGFERVRFHARGIGPIREVNGGQNSDPFFNGQTPRDVIFYRIDGVQDGSLEGTPFGGLVEPWFLVNAGP